MDTSKSIETIELDDSIIKKQKLNVDLIESNEIITVSEKPTTSNQLFNKSDDNGNDDNDEEKKILLSKRQQKKLKKIAQWEEKKKLKRQKEREKYRQKRRACVENGESIRNGPSRKMLKRKIGLSKNFLRVAVDLDFDDLMIDKDVSKCVKQLLRIYTINRRSSEPAKLYFTGIKPDGRIHKCLAKNDGYENWNVNWCFGKKYTDVLAIDEIIYLTSDSDNVLDKLDENLVYIIGGIVDHNHQKGLCYDRAEKLELKTARLPLKEYVDMKARTVLSTVHVFEILLGLSEGKSWQEVILNVLPMRKGAKLKTNCGSIVEEDISITTIKEIETKKNEQNCCS